MPSFELAEIMPGLPEEIWDALVDFPNRPLHNRKYRRAELMDGTELEPGSRIELQIGRDRFTSVVTRCQRPQLLSHRATGPGFWVEMTYQLRVCDDGDPGYTSDDMGRGYLTIQGEYGGWLGSLVAKLRPGTCRRYLEDELMAIISAAESVPAEAL